jgi:hypothetical protein
MKDNKEKYSLEEAAKLAVALGATCYVVGPFGPSWYYFFTDETEEYGTKRRHCVLKYDVKSKELTTPNRFLYDYEHIKPITDLLKGIST